MTWLFILLERLFANTSAPLGRWTTRWFVNSMQLPDPQVEEVSLVRVSFAKGSSLSLVLSQVNTC
jgi:hypothetical protein